MNIAEVVDIFIKEVPHRRPVKYARDGDTWYLFTENVANGGKNLPTLIENGYFTVQGNKVLPTTPLEMPVNIKMNRVPTQLQKVGLTAK